LNRRYQRTATTITSGGNRKPANADLRVDDTPWVARGHGRERTFQRDLTEPAQVDAAIRQLVGEVLADVAREGRPAVRLTLKVRYAPFFTKTFSRTLPEPTTDAAVILTETKTLVAQTPGRATHPAARAARRDDDARAGPDRARTLTRP
jgi:nucleotidyltransferase/DNA polymerase involved in DNA repair